MTTTLRRDGDTLTGDEADAVRVLAGRAEAADGVAALGEQTLLNLGRGADVVHVLALPTGYAQLDLAGDGPASAELVVDPDHRRRGTGTALLAALRSAAQDAGRPLRVWAHGGLPGARALARSAGLSVRRELWRMARPLAPDDDVVPEPPDGVTLRPSVVGEDEAAWLDLNARAFADHPEQGRMTLADVRARQGEPWFRATDLLLAERDGRLVGSAWTKVEPGSRSGELYALAVDPRAQGTGLGRWLTDVVVAHLAGLGLHEATLYVEGDNHAAVRTYRRAGFERTHVDVQHG